MRLHSRPPTRRSRSSGASSIDWKDGEGGLFNEFKDARTTEIPHLLSDHTGDQNRIDTLKRHFRNNPDVFRTFDPNPASATAFTVPKNAPETFLR